MGNLLWEFPIDGVPIRPFIGGGAGMAYTHTRLQDPTGGTIYLKNSDWHFAWQGMAGLKFDVAPGARLSAMYRYFQVDDVAGRCGTAGQSPVLACRNSNTDQSVDIGLELDL
jgi:opacity protein-like surface antigen